jgi:hypothetical protein
MTSAVAKAIRVFVQSVGRNIRSGDPSLKTWGQQ